MRVDLKIREHHHIVVFNANLNEGRHMNTLIDSMIEVDDIPTHRGNAVNHKGDCIRCKSPFGNRDKCRECGVGRDRIIQRVRRRRKATGKRGRNSGTVGTAKQKKS